MSLLLPCRQGLPECRRRRWGCAAKQARFGVRSRKTRRRAEQQDAHGAAPLFGVHLQQLRDPPLPTRCDWSRYGSKNVLASMRPEMRGESLSAASGCSRCQLDQTTIHWTRRRSPTSNLQISTNYGFIMYTQVSTCRRRNRASERYASGAKDHEDLDPDSSDSSDSD